MTSHSSAAATCAEHPKYQAKAKPRAKCDLCWIMYYEKHPLPLIEDQQEYIPHKTADGRRCPGVTTIIGDCKSDGQVRGLMGWVRNVTLEGGNHKDKVDSAAFAGNIAHAMCEAYIKRLGHRLLYDHGNRDPRPLHDKDGVVLDPTGNDEKAVNCYNAFREWFAFSKLKLVESELRLTSEKYRFGGVLDCVVEAPDGTLQLLDFKTSNGFYEGHLIQVCAYDKLFRECRKRRFKRVTVLRMGKEFADFHWHSFGPDVIDMGIQVFDWMREIYAMRKVLRPLVK